MAAEFQLPGAPQTKPGLPASANTLAFETYNTLNTKPTRPAVQDDEMAWVQNFQPLGKNNLRAMWDIGTSLYSTGGGNTIDFFAFGNIADTSYCMVFPSDGSIQAVNASTGAVTQIAGTSTITNPANVIGMSQWGSQYILIIAPQSNGYFVWDGTLLYRAGTLGPTVTILSDGFGYTSAPALTISGGSGSGATATATVLNGSIETITITNQGSGYNAGDIAVISFSGGGSNHTATAHCSLSGGVVSSVTIDNSGTGYTSSVFVSFQGGEGFGATATASAASGHVTSVTVTSGGEGYVNPPTVVLEDPNNAVAVATIVTMPYGVQGTGIEVYTGRVWIVNGAAPSVPPPKNLVQFSAPGSPVDFSVADGAGAFTATNSFLRVGYHGVRQSNGFLYLIGDSSVDYISGVQTSGSPPITTFTNQNVDPQVGSPYPNTIQVFARDIMHANSFGIHAIRGGAVPKVSEPLDGIYATVPISTFSNAPSACVCVLNGIHCYGLLWPIINPYTGIQETMLLVWDGKRWFTANQSVSLTQVATLELNSLLTAYGSTGTAIYPLFQTQSGLTTKVAQSRFWYVPGLFTRLTVENVYGLVEPVGQTPAIINVNIDTENGTVVIPNANSTIIQWINNFGSIVQWVNNNGDIVEWVSQGTLWFQQPTNANGILVGTTITSTSEDLVLVAIALLTRNYDLKT